MRMDSWQARRVCTPQQVRQQRQQEEHLDVGHERYGPPVAADAAEVPPGRQQHARQHLRHAGPPARRPQQLLHPTS